MNPNQLSGHLPHHSGMNHASCWGCVMFISGHFQFVALRGTHPALGGASRAVGARSPEHAHPPPNDFPLGPWRPGPIPIHATQYVPARSTGTQTIRNFLMKHKSHYGSLCTQCATVMRGEAVNTTSHQTFPKSSNDQPLTCGRCKDIEQLFEN